MDTLKNWEGNRYQLQLLILKLVCWLGWLSGMVFGQLELSEPVTGSVNLPDLGMTCLGNLAAFVTICMKGMFPLEMGLRDVLAATRGPKLVKINGFGLSTCSENMLANVSVVMLATQMPNSSIRQFMKYVSNAHDLESILLQCVPIKSCATISAEICECECNAVRCGCIVFSTVEEITIMLAGQIPGILKKLSDSLCLLPSLNCLRRGCHGCNHGLLHVENKQRLREDDFKVESPAAVCRTLHYISRVEERNCICIPVHPPGDDHWTKLLARSFTSKDKEERGAIVMASDALKKYLAESREERVETVEFTTISFIMPRFVEVLVNLLLTGWFRVDGFSSALVARKAVRNYVVDSKGNGFAANAFLTKALVCCNADNNNVCQVLTFRGNLVNIRTLAFIVGFANLICSISWIVLIAIEGGPGKWYDRHSMPPSKARVALIMAAMGYSLLITLLDLHLSRFESRVAKPLSLRRKTPPVRAWVAMIVLEVICIVYCSAVVGALGIKGFGTWLYSVVQAIVWVKWGISSYLLGEYLDEGDIPRKGLHGIVECGISEDVSAVRMRHGILMYCTAFLFNAFLAGVRGKWKYSWKGFTM